MIGIWSGSGRDALRTAWLKDCCIGLVFLYDTLEASVLL